MRHITERHDNLLRENTYMRHMLSEQTQKLNHLLQRENEEMEKERRRAPKSPQSSVSDASSGDDSNDSGIRSPPRAKNSSFSINFLSQSSKDSKNAVSDRIPAPLSSIPKPTTSGQGSVSKCFSGGKNGETKHLSLCEASWAA